MLKYSSLLAYFVLFVHYFGYSQPYSRTTLKQVETTLLNTTEAREKVLLMHELAAAYHSFNLDTATIYAQYALNESTRLNDPYLFHQSAYILLSTAYHRQPAQRIVPYLRQCWWWFRVNGYYEEAIKTNILYTSCLYRISGRTAGRKLAEQNLAEALKTDNNKMKANAWLDIKKFQRNFSTDPQYPGSLDSAHYYYQLQNDSAAIVIFEMYRLFARSKTIELFAYTYPILERAKAWKNPKIIHNAYLFLSIGYSSIRMKDSALYCIDKAIEFQETLNSPISQLRLTNTKADILYRCELMEESANWRRKALEEEKKLGEVNVKNMALMELARVYLNQGKYEEAIQMGLLAQEQSKKLNYPFAVYRAQHLLGNLYRLTKEYDKATNIYTKALAWIDQNYTGDVRIKTLWTLHSELGRTALEQGKPLESIPHFEAAQRVMNKSFHRYSIETELELVGVYLTLDEIHIAQEKFQLIVDEYSEKMKRQSSSFNAMKGRLLIAQGNFDEGIKATTRFLTEKESFAFNSFHREIHYDLATAYEQTGQYANALEEFKIYNQIDDSLKQSQSVENTARIQSKYELNLKENTIKSLKRQQEIQTLKLDRQLDQLQLRQAYIILLIIALLFLATLGYLFFRRYRQQREKEKMAFELANLKAQQRADILETKNALFANISHEFRTPLTLIRVPLQNHMESQPHAKHPLYEGVLKNVDELLGMLDEILDSARMESGDFTINRHLFSLDLFFQELKTTFIPLFEQKNIEASWNLNIDDMLFEGDEKRLRIVVNNLLKNAHEHTPEFGKISLAFTSSDNSQLVISVANSGHPINEKDLPHIFTRFYRSNETQYTGAGIGLSLCKQITELHGGTIKAENKPDAVCFTLSIPGKLIPSLPLPSIQPISKNSDVISAESTPVSPEKTSTVLIVEDNLKMRDLLNEILQDDHQLIFAKDGEEGEKLALQHQPQLILSDIMMPRKNGYELLNAIKQNFNTSHIPVVLLTAKADSTSRIKGLNADADDYLAKPFDPNTLKARIKNLLRQRRQLQQFFAENPFLHLRQIECSPLDADFLQRAREVLEEAHTDSEFSVKDFCSALASNRNSVHNKIKAFTGGNTSQFIRNFRLEKALELLVKTPVSITEIYVRTGFKSPQVFARAFKERFDLSPTAYREKHFKKVTQPN